MDTVDTISKNIDDAYNLGVDYSINVVQGCIEDLKQSPGPLMEKNISLLNSVITRLINIKK